MNSVLTAELAKALAECERLREENAQLRLRIWEDRGWNDIGIQEIYTALVHDDQRSNLIVADVEAAIEEERFPLLLTEGTDHLEILFEKLVRRVPNVL